MNDEHISLIDTVKSNGLLINNIDVNLQTEELCLAAVNQNTNALNYIKNPTEKIYIAAVRKDHSLLDKIPNAKKTSAIYLAALDNDYWAFDWMENVNNFGVLPVLTDNKKPNKLVVFMSSKDYSIKYCRNSAKIIDSINYYIKSLYSETNPIKNAYVLFSFNEAEIMADDNLNNSYIIVKVSDELYDIYVKTVTPKEVYTWSFMSTYITHNKRVEKIGCFTYIDELKN